MKKKSTRKPAPEAELPTIPRSRFNRKAVVKTLAEAREEGTESDHEGRLVSCVLRCKRLDWQTHFDTCVFVAALYCKITDMPVTNRQALFSDPAFARALYSHLKLAFPAEVGSLRHLLPLTR